MTETKNPGRAFHFSHSSVHIHVQQSLIALNKQQETPKEKPVPSGTVCTLKLRRV